MKWAKEHVGQFKQEIELFIRPIIQKEWIENFGATYKGKMHTMTQKQVNYQASRIASMIVKYKYEFASADKFRTEFVKNQLMPGRWEEFRFPPILAPDCFFADDPFHGYWKQPRNPYNELVAKVLMMEDQVGIQGLAMDMAYKKLYEARREKEKDDGLNQVKFDALILHLKKERVLFEDKHLKMVLDWGDAKNELIQEFGWTPK